MKTPTPNALMFAAAALLPAPVSGLHAADIAATPAGPGVSAANGVSIRPGKTADIKANPDGSFTLTKGVVLVTADGRPITLKNDGKDITVTGGTYFIQAGRSGALTLVTLAGDATVAPAGGESFDIPEGHHTAVSPAGTHTEVLAVDIAAMSRSSALLKATNLPAKTRDAIATAVATQHDAIEAGDLAPTRQLIVSASSARGLGVASAQDVQAALNAANTGILIELDSPGGRTGEDATPYRPEAPTGAPAAPAEPTSPTTPSAPAEPSAPTPPGESDPLNDYLFARESYYNGNFVFNSDQSFTQDSNKEFRGLSISNSAPVSISLAKTTPSATPRLELFANYDITLTNCTLSAPSFDADCSRSITLSGCAVTGGSGYWNSEVNGTYPGTGSITVTDTTFDVSNQQSFEAGDIVTLKNVKFMNEGVIIDGYWAVTRQVDLDGVSFLGIGGLSVFAKTINLKNVTFSANGASLYSRDGILNIGSSMDGAVNFIQNVKLGTTDLTTKDGINSFVKLGAGGLRYQGGTIDGTPLEGTTGVTGEYAPVTIGKVK